MRRLLVIALSAVALWSVIIGLRGALVPSVEEIVSACQTGISRTEVSNQLSVQFSQDVTVTEPSPDVFRVSGTLRDTVQARTVTATYSCGSMNKDDTRWVLRDLSVIYP